MMRRIISFVFIVCLIVGCRENTLGIIPGELYHVTTTQGEGYVKFEKGSGNKREGTYYANTGILNVIGQTVVLKAGKEIFLIDAQGNKLPVLSLTAYESPKFQEFAETWAYKDSIYKVRPPETVVYGRALGYWTSYPDTGGSFLEIFNTKLPSLYNGKEELDLTMDMYIPDDNGKCSRPLLVLIHGGAFFNGDKASLGFPELARYFAGLGYVVASVNYRMGFKRNTVSVERAGFRAVQDVDAAIRYIVHDKSFEVDSERVFVAGTSSGGITALNVAFMKDKDIPPLTAISEGGIKSINPEIDETYSIRAVGNMWGAVNDLSILDNTKTSVVSFHSMYDPIVPFGAGHPFRRIILNEVIFPMMYGSGKITEHLGGKRAFLKPYSIPDTHTLHIDTIEFGHEVLNSRFIEIKEEMHNFFSDVMLPSPVKIEHVNNSQRFYVSSDDVEILFWKVDGGVILKKDNNSADVLLFSDSPSHTVSVSGKYKSGLTFYETLEMN